MNLKWGRSGLVAGAITATFVTPIASDAGIHRAQIKPAVEFEFKHVTPVDAEPGVNHVWLHPDFKFEFRYITPTDTPAPTPNRGGKSASSNLLRQQILREDEEIMILVAAAMEAIE